VGGGTARRPADGRRRRLPVAATAGTLAVALGSGALAGCRDPAGPSGPGRAGPGTQPAQASAVPPATASLPADQARQGACDLVTPAEVEAAIGQTVGAGRQEAQEGRSLCSFGLASGTDESVALLLTSSSGVRASFEAARRNATAAQPIDAGEEAFVNGGQALVRKGDTMVVVLVVLRREPAQLAGAAADLARTVGARL
jgi:hypothetical protein